MKIVKGFTLIELMVVVAIIGILASVSLPNYQKYLQRSEIVETMTISYPIKQEIENYYQDALAFPANNAQAGVPDAKLLIGNRVTQVVVEDGAVHITLGNKASPALSSKVLTFRPAVVIGSPSSPMTWLCGYDEPVNGMKAVGSNKTDISPELLPKACRL